MVKRLTVEELLVACVSLPSEDVDVPALGGKVTVRGVTDAEMDAFRKTVTGPNGEIDQDGFAAKLVALSVLGDAAKIDVVQKWPTTAVIALAKVAFRLNGLAQGNSEATGAS